MILSAISDSSRPDHINQGLRASCCEGRGVVMGWGGVGWGWGGTEAGVAPELGLGINATPA